MRDRPYSHHLVGLGRCVPCPWALVNSLNRYSKRSFTMSDLKRGNLACVSGEGRAETVKFDVCDVADSA